MDTIEFLTHRAAFAGVPFGELTAALERFETGTPWGKSLGDSGRALRRMAGARRRRGTADSSRDAWLWAASAYQAASLELHLERVPTSRLHRAARFRSLARACYRRALDADPALGREVRVPHPGGEIHGYWRLPAQPARMAVTLFNGLDSICEVEMHAFGSWMLERRFAVLALDLPAGLSTRPRRPLLEVEQVAPAVADWVEKELGAVPLAAFGVSFGGHLVARALSGERRIRAGVAVSPGAWVSPQLIEVPRLRAMLRFAFALDDERQLEALVQAAAVQRLSPPEGRLLVLHMEDDALFGREHAIALREWGGHRVEIRTLRAEHVGTSRAHVWLPEICDWLEQTVVPIEKEENDEV